MTRMQSPYKVRWINSVVQFKIVQTIKRDLRFVSTSDIFKLIYTSSINHYMHSCLLASTDLWLVWRWNEKICFWRSALENQSFCIINLIFMYYMFIYISILYVFESVLIRYATRIEWIRFFFISALPWQLEES